MNPRIRDASVLAFLLLASELGASFLCWSGLPLDASPDPHFNFWYLEGWRLKYWVPAFSFAFLIGLLVRWLLRTQAKRTKKRAFSLMALTNVLAAFALATGGEVLTSLLYQRRLPFGLSFGMSAFSLSLYLQQHLIGWTLLVTVGLGALFIHNRRTHQLPSTPNG